MQWLYMLHVSDTLWCSTAVAVVAQTSDFVSASYFDRNFLRYMYMFTQRIIIFRDVWHLIHVIYVAINRQEYIT